MIDPTAAVVVSQRHWAARLHRYALDHGGLRIKRRVMRPEDALDDAYDVFVVDDITSFLTPRLVADLHQTGHRVLGVYDPDEFPEGAAHLTGSGVDAVIEAGESPEAFVEHIERLRTAPAPPDQAPEASPNDADVVVVGGPPGGVGVTEVAIALAVSGVLIDADRDAPSVAQRLDLPPAPNLTYAIDRVRHNRTVGDLVHPLQATNVLVGVPTPSAWQSIRPADVRAVVDGFADHGRVIVDIGHGADHPLIDTATGIVVVGAPSPVGAARLLSYLAELREHTRRAVHVAINRVPGRGFVTSELEAELTAVFEPATLTFLADDRRVTRAAWEGVPVARGPFRRGARGLARVVGVAR